MQTVTLTFGEITIHASLSAALALKASEVDFVADPTLVLIRIQNDPEKLIQLSRGLSKQWDDKFNETFCEESTAEDRAILTAAVIAEVTDFFHGERRDWLIRILDADRRLRAAEIQKLCGTSAGNSADSSDSPAPEPAT